MSRCSLAGKGKIGTVIKPVFSHGPSKDAIAIREEVFCREQGYRNEFDDLDKESISLVLYLDEYPIATGRLVKLDPARYQAGRLAVRKEYRGRQVGSYLLRFLCKKAKELGATTVIVHSQLDKRGFYLKLGFRILGDGEIDFDEGNPHVYMIRDAY